MSCCARCELDPLSENILRARGQTIGGLLPTIVYPSDVDRKKREIDVQADTVNRTVDGCAALDASTRGAWQNFYREWKSFAARETPLFGAANEWDQALTYQSQLAGWQDRLRSATCAIIGPDVPKPPPEASSEDITSAVKFAAVAIVAAAAVYAVAKVL